MKYKHRRFVVIKEHTGGELRRSDRKMEQVEMSGFSRHRGCWDSASCWAVLGESRPSERRGNTTRLVIVTLVVSLALLALPAATLMDGGGQASPMRSLVEKSMHTSAEKNRLLTIAKIELKEGARGARQRAAAAAQHKRSRRVPGLFSKAGLRKSTAAKEKLLLNLLKNLETV